MLEIVPAAFFYGRLGIEIITSEPQPAYDPCEWLQPFLVCHALSIQQGDVESELFNGLINSRVQAIFSFSLLFSSSFHSQELLLSLCWQPAPAILSVFTIPQVFHSLPFSLFCFFWYLLIFSFPALSVFELAEFVCKGLFSFYFTQIFFPIFANFCSIFQR